MRPLFRNLVFTLAVILLTLFALWYPDLLLRVGNFDTRRLIVPLLMLIMLGMGMTMSIRDFYGVFKIPAGVLIGVLCQFSIMPLVGYFLGYSLSRLARLDKESCRTVAFEVGMQNSGLASGIALEMGRVATMGLAPAVLDRR